MADALDKQADKVRKRFKAARRNLKTLHGSASETLKAAQALQAALKGSKPPPKPDAKVTELANKAGKLEQLTRFQQAAARYGTLRDDTEQALSKRGQQRWMLNSLVKMADISANQHTGGTGEHDNRNSTREISKVLKGLQTGQKRLQTAGTRLLPPRPVQLEVDPDTAVSSLDDMVQSLKSENKRLKVAQVVFKKSFGAVEGQLDELAEALSDRGS